MHRLNHKMLLQRLVVIILVDLTYCVIHHIFTDGQALLVEIIAILVGLRLYALLGAVHVLHVV